MTDLPEKSMEQIIAQNCVAVRMRLINRVVTSSYDDALRPLGIKANQMTILVFITKCGYVTQKDIQDALHMEKSTVSRTVERMRKKGWIESSVDGKNQRLVVTSSGRTILEESFPLWQKAQDKVYEFFGKERIDNIMDIANLIWSKK